MKITIKLFIFTTFLIFFSSLFQAGELSLERRWQVDKRILETINRLLKIRRYHDALSLLERFKRESLLPGSEARSLSLRGRIYEGQKKFRKAQEVYTTFLSAHRHHPLYPDVLYRRAHTKYKSGEYREARRDFYELFRYLRKGNRGHHLYDNALFWSGMTYYKEKNWKMAKEYYEKTLRLAPWGNKAESARAMLLGLKGLRIRPSAGPEEYAYERIITNKELVSVAQITQIITITQIPPVPQIIQEKVYTIEKYLVDPNLTNRLREIEVLERRLKEKQKMTQSQKKLLDILQKKLTRKKKILQRKEEVLSEKEKSLLDEVKKVNRKRVQYNRARR